MKAASALVELAAVTAALLTLAGDTAKVVDTFS